MRTFIAIKLSDEIKDYLGRLQRKLKESQADVKWVEPKNIHLTLKFLGDQDETSLAGISSCLQQICAASGAYKLLLGQIGAFPTVNSPRVIWIGLAEGDKETALIAQKIEDALENIGIAREKRPFSSHITIGRTRTGRNIAGLKAGLSAIQQKTPDQPYSCGVKTITLFKSTLTPRGPVYEVLQEFPLT